jgi:predicted RNase H-like HicB family nuclease
MDEEEIHPHLIDLEEEGKIESFTEDNIWLVRSVRVSGVMSVGDAFEEACDSGEETEREER